LREHTRLPAARADVVRAFCAQLAADWSIEVWPHFWNAGDQWEIDWEQLPDGRPAKAEVAQALAAHRGASRHAASIVLSTAVGDIIRQARADLEPGAAVVLDTVIRADGCLSDRPGGSASHSVVPVRVSGRSGCRVCGLSAGPVAKAS
jgi:hypothetical protein